MPLIFWIAGHIFAGGVSGSINNLCAVQTGMGTTSMRECGTIRGNKHGSDTTSLGGIRMPPSSEVTRGSASQPELPGPQPDNNRDPDQVAGSQQEPPLQDADGRSQPQDSSQPHQQQPGRAGGGPANGPSEQEPNHEQQAEAQNQQSSQESPQFGNSACQQASQRVQQACDGSKSSDIHTAMGIINTISNSMTMMTANNVQMACTSIGRMTEAANAALTAYKGYCWQAASECRSSCGKGTEVCENAYNIIGDVSNNITGLIANMKTAEQCRQLTSMNDCSKNPYAPNCAGSINNCNTAAGANNPICRCLSTPNDPTCAQLLGKANPTSTTSGQRGTSSSMASVDPNAWKIDGVDGGMGVGEELMPMQKDPTGGGKGPGGGGGRAVSASTSDPSKGGGNQGYGGGYQGSSANPNISAGVYGGGGAGGFGRSGQGATAGQAQQGYIAGRPQQGAIDLRDFLPGGKRDPKRRPAGVTGPDGITGPNGNIFEKISIRYMAIQHTLLPGN